MDKRIAESVAGISPEALRLAEKGPKDKLITIRATEAERDAINKLAKELGTNTSDLLLSLYRAAAPRLRK